MVGKKLSSLRSAYAEQGGRAVFRRKQGDVDDRQCDHRDPSQRITPSVLDRTGVCGAAAYDWLGAACSCGQNKIRRLGIRVRLRLWGPYPSSAAGGVPLVFG